MMRKIDFWNNLRESFSFFGLLGTGGMAGADAIDIATIPPSFMAIFSGGALVGAVLSHFIKIWFVDKDGDGIVDILQKKK